VPSWYSDILDGEQQRVAVPGHSTFSDGVNTHIAAGLSFQPTSLATTHLSQHAPAPYFCSTALHVYNSFSNRDAIINPTRLQTSAFTWRFYLPDES
jgi:hypothetical protein